MVNQTAKLIEGSFDQGHQPMRIRSFRKRAPKKDDFMDSEQECGHPYFLVQCTVEWYPIIANGKQMKI
jgi:hypothetical protein